MLKRPSYLIALAWLVFYAPFCFAPDPEGFLRFELAEDPAVRHHGFLIPNETFPQDGESIFRAAGPGAYVTVGTERGFIHFALTPAATHLVLVDTDPQVARFNEINRMLLAASTSREDYLRLRTAESIDVWKAAAARNGGKVKLDRLTSVDNFEFWYNARVFTRDGVIDTRMRFAALEHPTAESLAKDFFTKGNYLYDDVLYTKLSRAAKEGRIQVENFSLNSAPNFRAMLSKLKEAGIPLSVFDMSNAWWQSFTQKASTEKLLQICAENGGDKSLFVVTDRLKGGIENFQRQLPHLSFRKRKGWVYLGFTFKMIEAIGGPGPFMDFMFLDVERPERLAVLNALNTVPYQRDTRCSHAMGKTVIRPQPEP